MPRRGAAKTAQKRHVIARQPGLLTRREAAEITGTSLSTINKAIEQHVLPVHRADKQPLLDADSLALITIFELSPVRLPVGIKQQVRKWIVSEKPYLSKKVAEFAVGGGPLVIRCTVEVSERAQAGERYARDRDRFIVSDPDILGGAPVIRDTRMLASTVAGRIDGGDTFELLESEFPMIPREAFEAAYSYAKSNPRRGRPTKPWRKQEAA